MSDAMYESEYGWQWACPEDFAEVLPFSDRASSFGTARRVVFRSKKMPSLHLSWAVLNGPPIDYVTDARFKSIASDRNGCSDLNRLNDVLQGIMPPAGTIVEAHSVRLPDHAEAVEMTLDLQSLGKEKHLAYVMIFPLEPAATDRGSKFDYNAVSTYIDPISGHLLVLSPVLLGEHVNPDTGDVARVYQAGHDRYQRIIMSGPESDFSKVISAVRIAAHGFHYKLRARPLRESWDDAFQAYHQQVNVSFDALNAPPAGLRDEDIVATRTPPN